MEIGINLGENKRGYRILAKNFSTNDLRMGDLPVDQIISVGTEIHRSLKYNINLYPNGFQNKGAHITIAPLSKPYDKRTNEDLSEIEKKIAKYTQGYLDASRHVVIDPEPTRVKITYFMNQILSLDMFNRDISIDFYVDEVNGETPVQTAERNLGVKISGFRHLELIGPFWDPRFIK